MTSGQFGPDDDSPGNSSAGSAARLCGKLRTLATRKRHLQRGQPPPPSNRLERSASWTLLSSSYHLKSVTAFSCHPGGYVISFSEHGSHQSPGRLYKEQTRRIWPKVRAANHGTGLEGGDPWRAGSARFPARYF